MKQREVSTAEHLEAKLTIRAMRKHEQLWKAAEGRLGWRESLGSFLPLLVIGVGLLQLLRDHGFAGHEGSRRGCLHLHGRGAARYFPVDAYTAATQRTPGAR